MGYILATTHKKVQWYKFNAPAKEGEYELLKELDLDLVPEFSDKKTAQLVAAALGLKTWRYVKLI